MYTRHAVSITVTLILLTKEDEDVQQEAEAEAAHLMELLDNHGRDAVDSTVTNIHVVEEE